MTGTHIQYCMCWLIYCTWEKLKMFPLNLPVPGAVHGLECKDVIFHREGEHVFAVVLPVARCLPQFAVIDVGGGNFLKASSPVLALEKTTKLHQQARSASWPGQVFYLAEMNHDFWLGLLQWKSCGLYLSICFP